MSLCKLTVLPLHHTTLKHVLLDWMGGETKTTNILLNQYVFGRGGEERWDGGYKYPNTPYSTENNTTTSTQIINAGRRYF